MEPKKENVEKKKRPNRWMGLLFICVSLLVISLDNTILNVALPSISTDLGASQSDLQWIVDSYILVFAALLLTMGSVGDRIGRKRVLQFGVIWFGVFSLMAALSKSTETLIVARALLGFGGAMIMPATLSLVTATFDDVKERAQAIALWAAIFGLGIGVGPLLGGWLLEHYEWNSVFFVNLPVVAAALIGGHFFLEESRDEHAPSPDYTGVLLSIAALFLLVYGIIEAGVDGWEAAHVVQSLIAAGVLLVLFGIWESRASNAMLPMFLFRNPSFTGANVAMTLMMFGMFGAFFAMSQLFQSVLGYTALQAGLRLFPISVVIMITAGMSARVAARLGTKLTGGLGFLVAATGMFILSQTVEAGIAYSKLLPGMIVMSAGMGTAMSPATNSIMGSVPRRKAGVGSAMNDTTREVGGALGVAVLGTLMNSVYLDEVASLQALLPADQAPGAYEAVSSSIQGAHIVAQRMSLDPATGALVNNPIAQQIVDVANAAFANGMAEAMIISAVVMAVAATIVFLVLPSEIRCLEDECAEEGYGLSVRDSSELEAVSAVGD
ncbi:MAG: MFS transporter [Anaerolineae bacterium]|nr:MFS transporter [Anaerolineae bacterium]